ncbi:MAG: hypothetical protein GJ677_04645 [Rhodobacteraceae bacterium]|nr:hypothetical protein [Paracoccaceae bacterium]
MALRNTIEDIQALHNQLQQHSGDAASQQAIDQQKSNLSPFLDKIDTINKDETFRKLLFYSSATAAAQERADIATRAEKQLLAAQQAEDALSNHEAEANPSATADSATASSSYDFIHYLSEEQIAPVPLPEFTCNGDIASKDLARAALRRNDGVLPAYVRDLGHVQSEKTRKVGHYSERFYVHATLHHVGGKFVCVSAEIENDYKWRPGVARDLVVEVFDATGVKSAEQRYERPIYQPEDIEFGYGYFDTYTSEDLTDPNVYILLATLPWGQDTVALAPDIANAIPGVFSVAGDGTLEMYDPINPDILNAGSKGAFYKYVPIMGRPHILAQLGEERRVRTVDFTGQVVSQHPTLHDDTKADFRDYAYLSHDTFALRMEDRTDFVRAGVPVPGSHYDPQQYEVWGMYPALDDGLLMRTAN